MAFSEPHEKDQDEDDENDNDVVMGNNSNNNSHNDGGVGGGSGDVGFSKLLAHKGAVTSLVVVGRGTEQLLISGSLDGQIHMWDVRSGQLTLSFKKHTSGVKSMSVFWADAACNFPERKNCLVGRLQKFQWSKETVQPVPLWVNPSMCVVHDESASSRVHSLLRRQGSSSKSALSSSGTKRGDRGDEEQQVVTAQAKRN
jgi:WD40 repeat protein